jgi:hypothetical protein
MDLDVHYRGYVIVPVKTGDLWHGVIHRLNGKEFNADGRATASVETRNCPDLETAVGTAKLAIDGIVSTGGEPVPRK